MVELDGDEVRISSRGRFAERDIVQVGCGAFNVYRKLLDFQVFITFGDL